MYNLSYIFKNVSLFLSISILSGSCTTSGPAGIFGKKSPHEQYGDKIKNAGLQETAMGKLWFLAAVQSLSSPLTVNLPYSETGYFAAEQPNATGLQFQGKRGEKININLSKKPDTSFAIYLDLWRASSASNTSPELLLSADSATVYNVDKDGNYILRLQPELLKGGEYTLFITTGPSLAFPVTPKAKSNIGSFWGAGRDNGGRKHEGIDIFAPRGTAAIAAADGTVTGVTENTLGGKVIFLRPDNKDITLYYAHLDKQLVQDGQVVKTGDTLGLIGNTGNARTTVPHLHFGIYTNSGAIDPLAFVNRVTKIPEKITSPLTNVGKLIRTNKKSELLAELAINAPGVSTMESNTLIKADAATAGWYKVSLPGGEKGFVASSAVSSIASPVRKTHLKTEQTLLDGPENFAARIMTLHAGEIINIFGMYNDFYYIRNSNATEGWINKKAL